MTTMDPEHDYDDGRARDDYARALVTALQSRGLPDARLNPQTGGNCRAVEVAWLAITDGDADYPTLSYGVCITDIDTASDVLTFDAGTTVDTAADAIANVLSDRPPAPGECPRGATGVTTDTGHGNRHNPIRSEENER